MFYEEIEYETNLFDTYDDDITCKICGAKKIMEIESDDAFGSEYRTYSYICPYCD